MCGGRTSGGCGANSSRGFPLRPAEPRGRGQARPAPLLRRRPSPGRRPPRAPLRGGLPWAPFPPPPPLPWLSYIPPSPHPLLPRPAPTPPVPPSLPPSGLQDSAAPLPRPSPWGAPPGSAPRPPPGPRGLAPLGQGDSGASVLFFLNFCPLAGRCGVGVKRRKRKERGGL